MSDVPAFPYRLLWEERRVVSVANLTRDDGIEFFGIASQAGILTETVAYPSQERMTHCRIYEQADCRARPFWCPGGARRAL